jgi:branched-chain amino acid transport system permease protein
MVGAYLAYGLAPWVGRHLHGGFFTTLAVGLLLSIALGYVLEWVFFSLLYRRDHLQQVLMTYALILVFDDVRSIVAGDDVHGVAPPGWLSGAVHLGAVMTYPVYRLFISAVCLLVALGLYLLLSRTRLGMAIRASASDRQMAQALGVDTRLLFRGVFAAGVALAALAGMIAAPVSSVYPGMGGQVLIVCFVIVVVGGIGSVRGAFVAALLVGLVDTFGKVLFQEAAGVLVYVTMAAILLARPQGLFREA